jgi:hypothetical protein
MAAERAGGERLTHRTAGGDMGRTPGEIACAGAEAGDGRARR